MPQRLPEPSVSAALLPKQVEQLAARRCACPGRRMRRDVELELVQALLVEREVDRAEAQRDAELLAGCASRADVAGAAIAGCPGIRASRARPWRCAARRRGTSSRPPPAGRAPCAGCRAGCAGGVGARRHRQRAEHLRRQLAAQGSSSASSSGAGRPSAWQSVLPKVALARACTSCRTSAGSSTRSRSPGRAPGARASP